MEIIIQTPHATPAEELKNFVQNNIGKLLHLYNSIETAEALLKIEKSDSADDKVC